MPRRDRAPQDAEEEAAQRTDLILKRLPAREWTVLGEIDTKHGVDHILIGPGGVFTITSRKPVGPGVRVRDGVLWMRKGSDVRADRPSVAINRNALDSARSLHREVRARTGRGPQIHPVVVLWCEFPQAVAESSKITFVHGRNLLAWLSSRPQQLDEQGRGEIVQAIRAAQPGGRSRAIHIRLPGRAA